jgi:phytanoyl-CoA hydroxylase
VKITNELFQLKESYEKDGFVHVRNVLTPEQVQVLKNATTQLAELEKGKLRNVFYSEGQINTINSLPNLQEFQNLPINSVIEKTDILAMAAHLFGEPVVFHNCEIFYKPPEVGRGITIHQDNFYVCIEKLRAITAWIALEEADRSNGTIFYYRGSHTLGELEHEVRGVKNYTCGDNEKIQTLEKVYIHANPGDCVFHNLLTVHGSEDNLSNRSRRTLSWACRAVDVKEDKKRRGLARLDAISKWMSLRS